MSCKRLITDLVSVWMIWIIILQTSLVNHHQWAFGNTDYRTERLYDTGYAGFFDQKASCNTDYDKTDQQSVSLIHKTLNVHRRHVSIKINERLHNNDDDANQTQMYSILIHTFYQSLFVW